MGPGGGGFERENLGQKTTSNQETYRATKSSIIMNAIAVGILLWFSSLEKENINE